MPVGSSEEDRAKLWRAGRDAFVQATFDFIGLMAEMKKAMITAFQCNCRDEDEVCVPSNSVQLILTRFAMPSYFCKSK